MNGLDLKIARIKAGVKQYELAARMGICQTMLSELENSKSELTETDAKIIRAFIRSLKAEKTKASCPSKSSSS